MGANVRPIKLIIEEKILKKHFLFELIFNLQKKIMKNCYAIFVIILLQACNKNSLELPPLQIPESFSRILQIDGVNKIRVTFKGDPYNGNGETKMILKNLTGSEMVDLKILLEHYKGEHSAYDSLIGKAVVTIEVLRADEEFTLDPPFPVLGADDDNLFAGILSYEGKTHILSGSYSKRTSEFKDQQQQLDSSLCINGYVLADGTSVLRLQTESDNHYSIEGTFTDTTAFNGTLINNNGFPITELILLPMLVGGPVILTGDTLTLNLQLENPLNTTFYISIKLQKD